MYTFEDATKKDLQRNWLTVFILVTLLLLSVIVFLALLANTNGKAAV